MCRVNIGHLRVTVGHHWVTRGNHRLNIGLFRLTPGHLRVGKKGYLMVTVGQLKENLTELHIIVRTTG